MIGGGGLGHSQADIMPLHRTSMLLYRVMWFTFCVQFITSAESAAYQLPRWSSSTIAGRAAVPIQCPFISTGGPVTTTGLSTAPLASRTDGEWPAQRVNHPVKPSRTYQITHDEPPRQPPQGELPGRRRRRRRPRPRHVRLCPHQHRREPSVVEDMSVNHPGWRSEIGRTASDGQGRSREGVWSLEYGIHMAMDSVAASLSLYGKFCLKNAAMLKF